MNEEYKEVKAEDLNKGDVVHVSFKSMLTEALYLNETVAHTKEDYSVGMEDGSSFHTPYSRFYLVEKAKNPLPTELGAVVEHTDGWKFVRVGEDDWIGISPRSGRSTAQWSDSEVHNSARKDV